MDPISVTRLLQVRKEISLRDQKVLVQALSSADLRAQSMAASLAGLRLKRALANPESDEYLGLVASPIAFAKREALAEWCLGFKLEELQAEAFEKIEVHLVPFPDEATEDERMQTLAKREAHEQEVILQRAKYIEEGLKVYREWLEHCSLSELESDYARLRVKSLVNGAWREARNHAELLYGVRRLDGEPYFSSLQEVAAVPGEAQLYLLSEVRSVNDIDPLHWSLPSSTDSPEAPGS